MTVAARVDYDDIEVGTEVPGQRFTVKRVDLLRYCGACSDFTMTHWNERVAKSVGLPDVIAHGTITIAEAVRIVTDWTDTMEPAGWTATVQTPKRQVMFTGKIVTHAPLRNRRDIDGVMVTSRVSEGFTEISWDGYTGYGMTEYIERLDADGIPIGWPL